jgi:hypothetical protein
VSTLHALPGPITDQAYHNRLEAMQRLPQMREDNIRLPEAHAARLSGVFGLVGLVGLALTVVGAFAVNLTHALAAFQVGLFVVTGASLGCMALTMIFRSVNAGWSVTLRRIFEQVASLLPFCMLGVGVVVVTELLSGGVLLRWMKPVYEGNHLLEIKAPFLNEAFFVLRFLVYAGLWSFLSWRLVTLSREQDSSGDRTLSRKARFMSGWGLLAFALSLAFFAFDFLMAQDFRFFSTMWGVYYFAISALAGVSLVAVVVAVLRFQGRLTGVVTAEHSHDLGKLVFAFTCFWAYIAFSQYFLIWYSNIPEETAWFLYRQQGGWQNVFIILCVAHFVVPFILFVSRIPKRSTLGLGFMGLYMLAVTVLDVIFIVRPMVYVPAFAEQVGPNPGPAGWWLDVAGIVGVFGVYLALLIRRLASAPLIPIRDPLLHEALAHKNYV